MWFMGLGSILQQDPDGPGTRLRHRRWRPSRRLTVVLVIGCVAIAGIFAANAITLDDYVLTPGIAQPVGPLISIPGRAGHHSRGQILLTDVFESQVTALQWPFYQLDPNASVYPAAVLFGPSVPASVAARTDSLEMVGSSELARVAALRRLGYKVPEHAGVVVIEVLANTPAAKLGDLRPGDAITALNGRLLPNDKALTAALREVHPGQRVLLSVAHVDGRRDTEPVVLAAKPHGGSGSFLGVQVATAAYFSLPFEVEINSDGIGGPSAGLAFTLGIINQLGGGDLTAGKRVAATGTISMSGAVGPVGGIPQKTIAVRKAGATVLLVPAGANYRQALSKAGPHLHVVAVSSLDQALAALSALGGRVPPHSSGRRLRATAGTS